MTSSSRLDAVFKYRHFDRDIIILCFRWSLHRIYPSGTGGPEAIVKKGPQRTDFDRPIRTVADPWTD